MPIEFVLTGTTYRIEPRPDEWFLETLRRRWYGLLHNDWPGFVAEGEDVRCVGDVLVERSRLGGVLLLKGKDNISSGNELYVNKLKSYANTLYWNETLRDDTYHSKLDFRDFAKEHGLPFRPLQKFGPEELQERQRLLFDMSAMIWSGQSSGGT